MHAAFDGCYLDMVAGKQVPIDVHVEHTSLEKVLPVDSRRSRLLNGVITAVT